MNRESDLTVQVDISPPFKGHVTPRGLIEPRGTVEFQTDYSRIGGPYVGYIFQLKSKDFTFEAGFTQDHFYLQRNDQRVEKPIVPIYGPLGRVHFFATWDVDRLVLTILDETYKETIATLSNTDEKTREVEKRTVTVWTPPTLPPTSLLRWARKESILPTVVYNTAEHLHETVASSIEAIADIVESLDAFNSFWDITYEGPRIVRRRPKRETDIHPTIHSLLFHIALAKNLEISREYPIAGGRLDFLVSGPLISGGSGSVCLEFKHAHSGENELLHGLLKQLPAYMTAKGSDFGIYCVMYFKGMFFEEPGAYDSKQLRLMLEKKQREVGLANIRTLVMDLSGRPSPSKL